MFVVCYTKSEIVQSLMELKRVRDRFLQSKTKRQHIHIKMVRMMNPTHMYIVYCVVMYITDEKKHKQKGGKELF